MSKKKILVYGYFGYQNNQLDGQTIKTRSIFELLKEKCTYHGIQVDYFDTQIFKKSKFNLLKSLVLIFRYNKLFYLPAHNNLKFIFPFIYIVCKISRIDIHYVVVGGWLHDFLKTLPLHRWMLRKVKCIYPQTKELVRLLENSYNFNNVVQLNNFRIIDERCNTVKPKHGVKLVFMARVHPQKGLNTIYQLADRLRKIARENVTIDIYGPIYDQYKEEFYTRIREFEDIIKYSGILLPEKIVDTLSGYDIFLFPTEYYTEGFPGSILEAYLADLPVVASNWQYAPEFVVDGQTGYISEFGNSQDFVNKVIYLLDNPTILDKLSECVKHHKHKYSPEFAWKILRQKII